jgi:hypothetical protein
LGNLKKKSTKKNTNSIRHLTIIGRRERIDLPSLGLKGLKAKIDTGAFSSSIHCHKIYTKKIKKIKYLYFNLLDPSHPKYAQTLYEICDFKQKKIKNSFGHTETRYVIKLPILIAGQIIETSFSLSDRSEMKYPILLGRDLLRGKFLVDVSKINQGVKLNNEYRKLIPKNS